MALTFNQVKPGDIILSLEMDKRGLYPIVEACKIIKTGKEYSDRIGNSYGRLIKLEVVDSTNDSFEVVLEADSNGSIYDRIFYSTDPGLILQELHVQKQRAQFVINNVPKYKTCIEECDKWINQLSNKPSSNETGISQVDPDFIRDSIKSEVQASMSPILEKITAMYNSLMGENK